MGQWGVTNWILDDFGGSTTIWGNTPIFPNFDGIQTHHFIGGFPVGVDLQLQRASKIRGCLRSPVFQNWSKKVARSHHIPQRDGDSPWSLRKSDDDSDLFHGLWKTLERLHVGRGAALFRGLWWESVPLTWLGWVDGITGLVSDLLRGPKQWNTVSAGIELRKRSLELYIENIDV